MKEGDDRELSCVYFATLPRGKMSSTVVDAILAIGPDMCSKADEAAAEVMRSDSCLASVRHAASIQDRSFFSSLPPALLHDDYHCSANKLYGGSEASKIANAAYRVGRWNEVDRTDRVYNGGAIFEFNGKPHPVLFFTADDALVAHVHGAPLAELEADLFDDRKPVSNLERKWYGDKNAKSAWNMRMHLGAVTKAGGLTTMPGFLLKDDYHLVRGVLPWLHFRAARTDYESELLTNALLAALAYESDVPTRASPFSPLDSPEAVGNKTKRLLTVFDTCADENAWVVQKVTAGSVANGKMPQWKPLYDRMQHDVGWLNREILGDTGRTNVLLCIAQNILFKGNWCDERIEKIVEAFPDTPLEEASDMARAPISCSLHALTAMVRTCGVVSPTRICNITIAPNSIERVAAATFAASDAVLAFRDVVQHLERGSNNVEMNSLIGCRNMAGRIKEPQAMLLIDLGPDYNMKSARLVNSAIDTNIATLDKASRLIACPWVTVVIHRLANTDSGWFTLDTSLVQRDLLTVTDSVRELFGAAPAQPAKPGATPEAVEALRGEMNAKMDELKKLIGEVNATCHREPPPAKKNLPGPLVQAESTTVKSLRAAAEVLERLTGRKRPVSENATADR